MNNTNRYNSNNMTSNRQNINGSYQVSFYYTWTCIEFYFQSNLSNRDMMNRVQVGQKRAGTPLSNQIVKQRQAMPAQRNTRPAQAKDVKERFIFLCDFIVKRSFRPKSRFLIDCGVIQSCTKV